MNRTELSALGEFGLLNQIEKNTTIHQKETIMGIGDDAAVLAFNSDENVLVSTDTMTEGVHFDLSYTPLKHLGYKLVSTNVSDIAAMNGIPKQILVSMALTNRFSIEAVQELYEGINEACQNYQVDLVGGDTTASSKGLYLTATIIGTATKDKIVYRNTAKKGDIICVTGDLGAAYIGLQLLRREKEVYLANPDMQPELSGNEYLIGRQLRPEARMDIVHELKEMAIVPTSMIDISDGLASEITHICSRSKLGALIYEDKLPLDNKTLEVISELNLSSTACMLNGGEDYELLFTISQSDFEKLKNHPDISTIGYMVDANEGINLVSTGNNLVPISAQGWVHF